VARLIARDRDGAARLGDLGDVQPEGGHGVKGGGSGGRTRA
jgi:hypothetical protein